MFTLDIINFGIHYYQHKKPILWKIHKVHHQVKYIQSKYGYHAHPFEYLIQTYILPFTSD